MGAGWWAGMEVGIKCGWGGLEPLSRHDGAVLVGSCHQGCLRGFKSPRETGICRKVLVIGQASAWEGRQDTVCAPYCLGLC